MELTYFMGVVTIDRKVDLDGATAILWWKYKLLRVRSNSNLVIPLGVLLMNSVLSRPNQCGCFPVKHVHLLHRVPLVGGCTSGSGKNPAR